MNDTEDNNYMIMGLLDSRWDNGDDEFLNRLMWSVNFSEFEKIGLTYFNFRRNTTIKIFNQVLAKMAIDLKIRATICPNRDDLHQILKSEMIHRMKEVKRVRQKYPFAEFLRRREAKLLKKNMYETL